MRIGAVVIATAAFFAFFLPGVLLAKPADYVTCVQKQLLALGVDPGPVDGVMGPQTRSAAAQVAQTHSDHQPLAHLAPLSRVSVVGWCRNLATLQPGLAHHQPAAEGPRIRVSPDLGDAPQQALKEMLEQALSFLEAETGLRPATRIDVIGGATPAELLPLFIAYSRANGLRVVGLKDRIDASCGQRGQYGGFATSRAILICWPPRGTYSKKWIEVLQLRATHVMVHEVMHIVQNELANATFARQRKQVGRVNVGPHWMVEGGAVLLELAFSAQRVNRERPQLETLIGVSAKSMTPLTDLRDQGAVVDQQDYLISHLAVHLLAARAGPEAVLDYWRELGRGVGWDVAFETAFGLPLVQFEEQFEQMRRNSEAAQSFIQGERE